MSFSNETNQKNIVVAVVEKKNLDKKYIQILDELIDKHNTLIFDYFEHGDKNLYPETIFLFGCLSRSVDLLLGCLNELKEENIRSFYTLLRAQIETAAYINYLKINPNYLDVAILGGRKEDKGKKSISVITMIKHLDKKIPNIYNQYEELSERIHPNSATLYTNFKQLKKEDNNRIFEFCMKGTLDKDTYEKYLQWTIKIVINILSLITVDPKES
ncbi:hypothetical protein KO465_03255 [Candidatus Micrarchaeota archaeon]|nr:hypothetical protein [Candidatus Micrarchaeota archaeon]